MTEAWTDPALKALRAACHTADGPSLLALLRVHDVSAVLQQCGDALATAVRQGEPGARETAAEYTAALRERAWPGDEVLTAQLDASVGGAVFALQPLPVDLEELSSLLEGDPVWGGGRIDLDTGECRPAAIDTEGTWDEEDEEDTGPDVNLPTLPARYAPRADSTQAARPAHAGRRPWAYGERRRTRDGAAQLQTHTRTQGPDPVRHRRRPRRSSPRTTPAPSDPQRAGRAGPTATGSPRKPRRP
ncbi:hypothetical protein [Streptomyces violascens]|uniref:hypothetical protein n=1 Tax=Streptomyces violascens TaxID=67381 RepID=UPI00364BA51B